MISNLHQILTPDGWRYPLDMSEETVNCSFVCPLQGRSIKGCVKRSELTDAYQYELIPRQHTNGKLSYPLLCGRPQRVHFADRDSYTLDMRKGDNILAAYSSMGYDAQQWGKGFLYATGNLYLHTDLINKQHRYRSVLTDLYVNQSIIGPPVVPYDASPVEKCSFILGYLSGAGWPKRFQTANSSFMEFFIENANYAGITLTGKRGENLVTDISSYEVIVIHYITYSKGIDTKHFRIASGPVKYNEPTSLFAVYLENNGLYSVKGGWTLGSD